MSTTHGRCVPEALHRFAMPPLLRPSAILMSPLRSRFKLPCSHKRFLRYTCSKQYSALQRPNRWGVPSEWLHVRSDNYPPYFINDGSAPLKVPGFGLDIDYELDKWRKPEERYSHGMNYFRGDRNAKIHGYDYRKDELEHQGP